MREKPNRTRNTAWDRATRASRLERLRHATYTPSEPRKITLPKLKFMEGISDANAKKGNT